MIIKMNVKVASDDEFMRCGSSVRERKGLNVWRRWKIKEDDKY